MQLPASGPVSVSCLSSGRIPFLLRAESRSSWPEGIDRISPNRELGRLKIATRIQFYREMKM